MLAKSIGRVARSAPPTSACTAAATATASLSKSARQSCCSHQRRQSSSKTSTPPGSSRSSDPATDNSTNASAEDEKRPNSTRLSKRKSKEASAPEKTPIKPKDEPLIKIPAVPPTNSLQLADVHTSSFFSLHRPISVTTSIPPADDPITIERFNDIFKPTAPSNSSKHKIDNVIYMLSDGPEEQRTSSGPTRNRAVRAQQLGLDNITGAQLDDMIRHFRPFHVPPPPVPFDDAGKEIKPSKELNESPAQSQEPEIRKDEDAIGLCSPVRKTQKQQPSRRTFTTTLTIQETTSSSGQKSIIASASPIRSKSYQISEASAAIQPFLQRMYERQNDLDHFLQDRAQREGGEMLAISVKRQRKLKMKKHKYKKLMKRTRVLRRNQGRL